MRPLPDQRRSGLPARPHLFLRRIKRPAGGAVTAGVAGDRKLMIKATMVDPYLSKLVQLLQPYEPDQIILFGSRARGEADEFSDYDLVVLKQTDRPFLQRLQDMVPYLVEFDRPAEILVYTPEEFEEMGESGLGWMIHKEGMTVYERPSG